MLPKESLLSELTKLPQASEQSYNLNFFCHTPLSYSHEQKADLHTLLAPYSAEFDIDESTLGMSASRKPIDAGIVDLIAPFKPLKGLSLWFSKAVYRKQGKKLQW